MWDSRAEPWTEEDRRIAQELCEEERRERNAMCLEWMLACPSDYQTGDENDD